MIMCNYWRGGMEDGANWASNRVEHWTIDDGVQDGKAEIKLTNEMIFFSVDDEACDEIVNPSKRFLSFSLWNN